MNITFLIGNGFDIGMGLKSRYSDYFEYYKKEVERNNTPISPLFEDIFEHLELWSDFETALGIYTSKFTKETKNNLIAQIRDFEKGFSDYLKEEQKQLEYDKDKICNLFLSALKSFYLNDNLPSASEDEIKSTLDLYKQGARNYNFISFNYTEILQKCIDSIPDGKVNERRVSNTQYTDKIGLPIIYIHGLLGNSPVMGVNDESQITNKELAEDEFIKKRLIKPIYNKYSKKTNDKKATTLINQSNIICIYGMSLGETDKKWWQLIINWLNGDVHRQLIIFVCDDQYSDSTQFDWMDKEDFIIEKLKSYMQANKIDIETLRPRIHIAINKNIFALNLRKDDNNDETTESSETDKRDAV